MSSLGNLEIQLLLNTQGFATGSKKALQMLNTLAKAGEKLGVFKKMDLKQAIGEIDKLNESNKKLQTSIAATSKTEEQLSSVSTKTATKLGSQSTATVRLSKESINLSDVLGKVGLGLLAVREYGAIISSSFTGFKDAFTNVSKLGFETDALKRTLQSLSEKEGYDYNKFVDDLKTKTAGAITELTLLKATTRAKFLGIDLKYLPTLFQYAAIRAKESGESVKWLVDSIVTGLGRKSALILDNAHLLMKDLNEAVIEVAKSHGHLIDKVDEEARQLYLNEAAVMVANKRLEESVIKLDDNAFAFERNNVKIEDMRARIGEQLQPVMLSFFKTLGYLIDIFTKLTPAQQKWVFIIGTTSIALGKLVTGLSVTKIALVGVGTASGKAATGMKGLAITMGTVIGIAVSLGTALALLDNRMQKISGYSINPADMLRYDYPLTGWMNKAEDKAMDYVKNLRKTGFFEESVAEKTTKAFIENLQTRTENVKQNYELLKQLYNDDDEDKKPPGNRVNKGREVQETEKQILSLLEQEKKKLDELKEKYDANADSQQAQFEIIKDIEKVQERLNVLQGIHIEVQDIDIENLDIALKKLTQIKDLSLTPEQEASRMLQLEEILKANRQQEREDILNSEEFGAAQLTFSSLANTFRSEFSTVISDLFGDSGFMAKLMGSLLSSLADKFSQFFISAALNSAFPGAGIITSIFGGGGASGGGAMPSGMPGGAGGFGGGDNLSLTSGMPNIAPILNTTVTQPPIILNIKSTVPMHEFMIEGMKTHNIYINEEKVK